jgi:hypothetical protein
MAENAAQGIGVKEVRRIHGIARVKSQPKDNTAILLVMTLSTTVVSFPVI